jgi:hypothetical protein
MTKDLENMADALPVPGDTETRAIPTVPVTGTHTPGPWRSDPSGQHIRSASNQAVARVYDVEPYSITETEANARLIAAAPD